MGALIMNNTLQLNSEVCPGNMNLLVEQVKKEEMDICQIKLCEITNYYLKQLKQTAAPHLEQTGDFIRLASILLLIKSRTLLPVLNMEEEVEEDTVKLQERLLKLIKECQQYKIAGKIIYNRTLLGRDSWSAGQIFSSERSPSKKEEIIIKKEEAPFLFIQSYKTTLSKVNRLKPSIPLSPIPSLTVRIRELSGCLVTGVKSAFSSLVKLKQRDHSPLLTFLSLLELSRLGFVSLFQSSLFSDIDVLTKKDIDESVFQTLDKEENDLSQVVRERPAV